jgi:hypothetical protein
MSKPPTTYHCGMEPLRLRLMTASEFAAFRSRLILRYAAEKARAAEWAKDEAEALAASQVDDLLPEGPGTPGMLLLTADDSDGQQVGLVWAALNRPRPGEAWIYDIEINRSTGAKAMAVPSSRQPRGRPPGTTPRL